MKKLSLFLEWFFRVSMTNILACYYDLLSPGLGMYNYLLLLTLAKSNTYLSPTLFLSQQVFSFNNTS